MIAPMPINLTFILRTRSKASRPINKPAKAPLEPVCNSNIRATAATTIRQAALQRRPPPCLKLWATIKRHNMPRKRPKMLGPPPSIESRPG